MSEQLLFHFLLWNRMNYKIGFQNWYTGIYLCVRNTILWKKAKECNRYSSRNLKCWFFFLNFSLLFKITPTNTTHNCITAKFYSFSSVKYCKKFKEPQSLIRVLSIGLIHTPIVWYWLLSISFDKSHLIAEGRKNEMHVWYWKRTYNSFF